MWYKIEEIEEKYGLTKFSIYALITQEPELRKYIKALEGVLQINEQGIGVLLKHASRKAENQEPATYADNNTIIMKPEGSKAKVEAEAKAAVAAPAPAASEGDLFADAFNTEGSFFDEAPAAAPKDEFFSNIELDYADASEPVSFMDEGLFDAVVPAPVAEPVPEPVVPAPAVVEEKSFVDDLIFADEEPLKVEEIEEEDEVNPEVYDGLPQDDFFSDGVDDTDFLDKEPEVVSEISAPTEEEYNMEGYLKALKAKLIIQNEQIRALDAYLEVSRKLLVQDEKIVNILEGMSRR